MLTPIVSVVLPVYNSKNYIHDSVNSILNQRFNNFELIIVDDHSFDGSAEIIYGFKDDRIKYIKNESNIGIVRSLNIGIAISKGKYIARMDSDDISLPDRFSIQVSFLEKNSDYLIVGSNYNVINSNGTLVSSSPLISYDDNDLKASLFFACPFIHPGIMFRKSILNNNNLYYNEEIKLAEDYVFYSSIMNFGKFYIPKEIIFSYRIHQSEYRITSLDNKSYMIDGRIVAWKIILDKLNIQLERDVLLLHDKFCYYIDQINEGDVQLIKKYLNLLYIIKMQNKSFYLFNQKSLENQISMRSYFVGKYLIQNNYSIIPNGLLFNKTTSVFNLFKLTILSIFK